jgi:hypothetical protein
MKQYTLITILNWETYQMTDEPKLHDEIANPPPKKKQKADKYPEGSSYYKMAKYFYTEVSKMAQAEGLSYLIIKADLQKWADDMRKLVEIDKVDKHLAKAVMDWVVQDNFWKKNVLSAKKLREKFPDLAIKMKAASNPRQPALTPQKDIRDKEIEFQRYVAGGGNPNEFDWGK